MFGDTVYSYDDLPFGKAIGSLITIIIITGFSGWFLVMLWGWFIVPLGVQSITWLGGCGIVATINLLTLKSTVNPKTEINLARKYSSFLMLVIQNIIENVIARAIFLGIGFLIHLLM